MKLSATLFNASSPGNVGGTLEMFFSTHVSGDRNNAGFWLKHPGTDLTEVYNLGATKVTLQATIKCDQQPNQLLLDSPFMQVQSPTGGYGGLLSWQSPPAFVPGTRLLAVQVCRLNHVEAGVTYDFGIDFVWDFDGHNGRCTGRWWATWA